MCSRRAAGLGDRVLLGHSSHLLCHKRPHGGRCQGCCGCLQLLGCTGTLWVWPRGAGVPVQPLILGWSLPVQGPSVSCRSQGMLPGHSQKYVPLAAGR